VQVNLDLDNGDSSLPKDSAHLAGGEEAAS
jgi:hypothetical protein